MNAGLVWLLRRAPVLFLRRHRKTFRGVKGVVLALAMLFFAVAVIVPAVIDTMVNERDPAGSAEAARTYGPLAMLSMVAITLMTPTQRRRGLYFRPHEIGFLFPAPLSRRELLAYHILSRAQVQVLSALWVTAFVVRYAPTWYGCLLGVTFALLFLQLLAQVIALLSAAIGTRVPAAVRWLALLSLAVVVVLAGLDVVSAVRMDLGLAAAVDVLRAQPVVVALTAPLEPFARTFAAETFADALQWGALSALVVLVLVAIVSRLDVAYEEAALDVARGVRRKLERMRSGGGALAALGPGKVRFRFPRLPFLGGAGPIAWRQCVEISRHLRVVVTSLVLLLLWPAVMGGAVLLTTTDTGESSGKLAAVVIPMLLVFSVVSTQNISFDFRRDLDRLPYLRSLPVSAFAVAAGQVAPSAVLLAVLQWISIALVLVATGALAPVAIPFVLPVLVPGAWAVLALDNLLFLLIPNAIDPDDPANVGFLGRHMLSMFLKFAALGVLGVVAAGCGAAAYLLAGRSPMAAAFAALLVVLAADVVLTWLVARTYASMERR